MSIRNGRRRMIDGTGAESRIGDRIVALLREEARLIHPTAELVDSEIDDAAEIATRLVVPAGRRRCTRRMRRSPIPSATLRNDHGWSC